MASTYTLNNGIELIGTGEQSGTWGDTTNTNLGLLDTALDGQVTITAAAAGSSGSPNSLPITDGSASNGRNRLINITSGSDLGATVFYQLTPNDAEKIVYIRNSLNAQDLIVFQGTYNSSNDYVIPNGTTAVVFFNGAGSGAVAANVFNNAHFDAMNVVGAVTVTTADNTAQLTLISTDADASIGPLFVMNRNSSSPADNDQLGKIQFLGEDDADNSVIYSQIVNQIKDASNSTEDGRMSFNIISAGADKSFLNMTHDGTQAEVVVNEESIDLDFRVESNNLANMLFIDGAEDKVFIGHGTTHQYDAFGAEIIMQIEAAGTAPYAGIGMVQNSNDSDVGPLIFGKSRGTSLGSTTIVQDDDLLGRIEFQGMDGSDLETGASIFAAVDGTPGADDMPGRLVFNTTADGANSPTERMRINNQGRIGIGTDGPLHVLDIDVSATGAIPTDAGMGTSTDNDNYFGFHNTSNSATFSGLSFETRTSGAARWLIANEWKDTYKGDLVFRTRNGGTSSSEVMRIINDGHLLIGKTADDNTTVGVAIHDNGFMSISRSANIAMILDRSSNEGEILRLTEAGTERGSLHINNDRMLIDSAGDAAGLRFDAASYTPFKNGSAADGTVDLGFGSGRFKDAYLSGNLIISGSGKGINFAEHTAKPGSNSQILDRFEKGTWTPTFIDGAGASQTISSISAEYTIIGDTVFVYSIFTRNNTTGTNGILLIGGLPFAGSSSRIFITGHMWIDNGGPSVDEIGAAYNGGGSTVYGLKSTTSAQQANTRYFQYEQVTNGRFVYMSLQYRTSE